MIKRIILASHPKVNFLCRSVIKHKLLLLVPHTVIHSKKSTATYLLFDLLPYILFLHGVSRNHGGADTRVSLTHSTVKCCLIDSHVRVVIYQWNT